LGGSGRVGEKTGKPVKQGVVGLHGSFLWNEAPVAASAGVLP
jgi:hypothetical protein